MWVGGPLSFDYPLYTFQHSSKFSKTKFSQIMVTIINNDDNVGSKISWWKYLKANLAKYYYNNNGE